MKVVQFTIPVSDKSSIVVQEDVAPHFYNHLHRHAEVQIMWILKGEGMLVTGNYMQRFQSGEIYLIGPNQAHVFKSDSVYFEPGHTHEVHSVSFFFNPDHHFGRILSLPELSQVRKFMDYITNGLQLKEEHYEESVVLLKKIMAAKESLRVATFIEILHYFSTLKDWKPLSSGGNEQLMSEVEGIRMDQVFQYVVNQYKRQISLSEISDIASLTPQAFCRYFKKHTGKTFVNFLNEVRVNEACKIIVSGKYNSISDIAYETGFDNVTNFNRVFKKILGQSPREYNRQYHYQWV
ncbi:helix-turn-helix domain-containing protein [Emticicia sp. CRIBPO]|uniref:helix-turn-helix domain-containing protein n=1 Tax=Emticicia sp. CRIBPO TaxID=2683258 RepID=UPI0014131744|nr:AraC family transcriptional regulator [Emticicia sp. CRIBPO]NBA87323.1 helix-turn-helix domain-containing protein [Emticicia sp. CRIBPO]